MKKHVVCQRHDCAFLDAEGIGELNDYDSIHLTRKGHEALAEKLAELIPTMVA